MAEDSPKTDNWKRCIGKLIHVLSSIHRHRPSNDDDDDVQNQG